MAVYCCYGVFCVGITVWAVIRFCRDRRALRHEGVLPLTGESILLELPPDAPLPNAKARKGQNADSPGTETRPSIFPEMLGPPPPMPAVKAPKPMSQRYKEALFAMARIEMPDEEEWVPGEAIQMATCPHCGREHEVLPPVATSKGARG